MNRIFLALFAAVVAFSFVGAQGAAAHETKPAQVIGPGDVLHELPDRNMVANNISSSKGAKFLVFQVGEIGKPLTVMVE